VTPARVTKFPRKRKKPGRHNSWGNFPTFASSPLKMNQIQAEKSGAKMAASDTSREFTADVILVDRIPVGCITEKGTFYFAGIVKNYASINGTEQKLPHIIEHSPEEAYFYSDIKTPINFALRPNLCNEPYKKIILFRISDQRVEFADVSIERRVLKYNLFHAFPEDPPEVDVDDPMVELEISLGPEIYPMIVTPNTTCRFQNHLAIHYIQRITGLNFPCFLRKIPVEFTALEAHNRLFGLIDHENNLLWAAFTYGQGTTCSENIVCVNGGTSEMDTQLPLEDFAPDEDELQIEQNRSTLLSCFSRTIMSHVDLEEKIIRMPRTKKYKIRAKLALFPLFDLLFHLENGKYWTTTNIKPEIGDWLIRCYDQVESKDYHPRRENVSFYRWKLDGAVWETLLRTDNRCQLSSLTEIYVPTPHQLNSFRAAEELTVIVTSQSWIERQFPGYTALNQGHRISLIKRSSLDEYFPNYVIPDIQTLIFEFICDGFIDDLDNPGSNTSKSLRKLYEDRIIEEPYGPDDFNPLRDFLLDGLPTKMLNWS
jgi:hypothetical protein